MIVTRKLVVTGLVQGVWFRKFVSDAAKQLNINGWVRNADDGSVEILAQGSLECIGKLESLLWQGTPLSDVQSVRSEPSQEPVHDKFRIW